MTNNPTIDGVSPKRGDRLFHVGNTRACPRGWVEFLCFDGCGEATVRTKNGAVPSVQVDHLQWHAMTDEQQLQEFYSELTSGGKLSKRALCHIRALQSTIAQVEGKLNKAIDLDFQRRETIEQLQARIAELESGRGEADAWALVNGNGQIRDLTDSWEVAKHWDGIVHSLHFAPPAPVAVVLPERATDSNCAEIMQRIGLYGRVNVWHGGKIWNACLDATAALNEERK